MSPISMDFIDLTDEGLEGRGRLKTNLALIDNLEIDIVINERGIWLSKTFSTNEIKTAATVQDRRVQFHGHDRDRWC